MVGLSYRSGETNEKRKTSFSNEKLTLLPQVSALNRANEMTNIREDYFASNFREDCLSGNPSNEAYCREISDWIRILRW